MNNQFQRTELLVGETGLSRLRKSHVMIVGCGAVGSFAAEALARIGVGKISLIDGDKVQESNINRQLCALHSTINQYKVDVLKYRINDICSTTQVSEYSEFLNVKNIESFFQDKPDYVIDAIDSLSDKVALILYLQHQKIPFISSMGAALKTDFRKIQVSLMRKTHTCPLASKVRKMVRKNGGNLDFPCVFSGEQPVQATASGRQMGSLMTITGMFGLICAHEAIRNILK